MKKLFVLILLGINILFASDFWETGWHQGNAMYHISNKSNDRLEIACNFESSSINLMDSEIGLGKVINVVFDNERKIITPTYISVDERTSSDDTAWSNFMYWLQNSKHFVIEAENGKKYTFEPANSQKVLGDISTSCTEYINGNSNQTSNRNDVVANEPVSNVPNEPFSIEWIQHPNKKSNIQMDIHSLADITVNNVIVNNGKCEIDIFNPAGFSQGKLKGSFPKKLEQYDTLQIIVWNCRKMHKIEIQTNYDSYFYNVD